MKWILSCLILLSLVLSAQAEEHGFYTALLKDYVEGDSVNYKDLSKDKRLGEYIEQLSKIDPEALSSREAKFAFWLNVYNAYSLKVIADRYPIKSINQLNSGGLVVSVVLKKTVWDKPIVIVNGKKLTLRAIDHEILRPQFKDSRIQFAIICGAVSCAPPMTEAFEAETLENQLET